MKQFLLILKLQVQILGLLLDGGGTSEVRRRHLRGEEAAPSGRGGGTFEARRRHLHLTCGLNYIKIYKMWCRVRDILMVFRIFVSNKSTLK